MKGIIFLIFVIIGFNLFANDGSFYASGNNLIPLQETEISLKKELLKFYVRDYKWMSVEVNFEFYNPGPEKKTNSRFCYSAC